MALLQNQSSTSKAHIPVHSALSIMALSGGNLGKKTYLVNAKIQQLVNDVPLYLTKKTDLGL